MSQSDLVSVIIPVFNRAHLVARSVGSLCRQSHENLEILVVDDCSSDDIEAAIAAIGDPRVRLLRRSRNGGAAAARNTGVVEARGDYIAFHDSDDTCSFDKIERQLAHLQSLPPDYIGVYCPVIFYTNLDEADYAQMSTYVRPYPRAASLSGDLSAITLDGNSFNLPTLLVRKAPLISSGLCDELLRNNEDWDLALRLTRQGKIGFVPEPMYFTQVSPTRAVSVSLVQNVNGRRISRSARYSAQSFVRITGKMRHAGLKSAAMASHYASAARYLLLIGHPRLARRFFRAALFINPTNPKLWVHLLVSYFPQLHVLLQNRSQKISNKSPAV